MEDSACRNMAVDQPHAYLQGQWYFSFAELHRLLKQRGLALADIDSVSVIYAAWM